MQRSLAMNIYVLAYLVLLILLVYSSLGVLGIVPRLRPGGDQPPPGAIIFFVVIDVLCLAGLILAARWTSASRRAWFWIVAAVPPMLFFLPDLPLLARLIATPESVLVFALSVLALASMGSLAIAAVVSALQARRV